MDIPPWPLDGIFLCILLSDEAVFEPLFCPIASNPLDSGLALPIAFFWICFVHFCQVFGQILEVPSRLYLPPFLAAASEAINFNLKGFKTFKGFKGFLLVDQQELASGEFM